MIRSQLLLLLFASVLTAATNADHHPDFDDISATSFTLGNGLRVVFSPAPGKLGIAITLAYGIGAVTDQPGSIGAAHILEHLMTDLEMPRSQENFTSLLARCGVISNAKTAFTSTSYFEYFPKSDLEYVLSLEAYRMTNLSVTEAHLNREKATAINEYKSLNVRQPYGSAIEDALRLSAPLFAYSHSPTGTTESIGGLMPATVMDSYRRFYRPSNCVLVIVGDLSRERVKRIVEQAFGGIKAPDAHRVSRIAPSAAPARFKLVEDEAAVPQTRLDILYRVRSAAVTEQAAAAVYRVLLNDKLQHLDSRAVAGATAAMMDQGDSSLIWTSALLEDGTNPTTVVDGVSKIASGISLSAPTPSELALIRRTVIDRMSALADDSIERARALASEAIEGRPANSLSVIAALQLEMPGGLKTTVAQLASNFRPFILITHARAADGHRELDTANHR